MSEANPPPPQPFVPPTARECPSDYASKDGACFKFGSHSSYEMAKSTCDSVGARLINIEPKYSKYIRNSVRSMGGNDFWIGSFIRNGRVYRQSGRTSCPIMRGQMINDALYGLVDCNSANRYICQKYGENANDDLGFNNENPFVDGAFGMDSNVRRPSRLNIPSKSSSTTASTTLSSVQEGGSNNTVIYAVIAAVIIIAALIVLRFVCKRYSKGKKKSKNNKKHPLTIKNEKAESKGIVFLPKSRKTESKASSIDSAVPPSNPSPSLEKSSELPGIGKAKEHKTGDSENPRMGRPRVNGPPPTRQPPHLEDKILWTYHSRTLERPKRESKYAERDGESPDRRCRRTYSDPRSDYGRNSPKDYYRGRRSSAYSEYSWASSDSDDDDDSRYGGGRRGPAKVYQRYPSQTSRHYGSSRRQRTESSKDRYYGRSGTYGRGHRKSYNDHHTNYYYNDGFDGGRRTSRARYSAHNQRQAQKDSRRQRPTSKVVQERQYFPQPHRLISWLDPGVIKDNVIVEPPNPQEQMRSLPREPIRVNRQIYQVGNAKHKPGPKKWRKPTTPREDQQHIYESLNEVKRTRRTKEAERKNSKKKDHDNHAFKRNANARASTRSVASIQSRKLPTPPI